MSVLPATWIEALEADASLWPGSLSAEGRTRLEALLSSIPPDVRDALLSSLVDPERNDWGRASVQGLSVATTAGARALSMATEDLIEMEDARSERFGLQPLGFRVAASHWGDPVSLQRLFDGLDGTFAARRYVLYVRRQVPADLDVTVICRAVQLWLGAIDRGDRPENHAVYEDEDVAIDLTLVDERSDGELGGRLLTIGPVGALERLGAVDARIVDAATRSEESIGGLPLIAVLSADRPWAISRGYIQQLLYGTPDGVISTNQPRHYEATFTPNGRSLFSDAACRSVAGLWFLEPVEGDPLGFRARVYENPWNEALLALPVAGARFAPVGANGPRGSRVLQWIGGTS